MDYISREAAISEFETCGAVFVYGKKVCKAIVSRLNVIPAADVVEVVRCRECKHFQLDAWGNANGVPLIVAHEICDLWAGGCKTNPDGYCFCGERKDGADNAVD